MAVAERLARWAVGCAIACVVPLAIWSGGCGDKTIVQADGGPADATSSDMGTAMQCCSESEGNDRRCSTDGTGLETCTDWSMAGQCASEGGSPNSYGYVWRVSSCPNGCTAAGNTASCNP